MIWDSEHQFGLHSPLTVSDEQPSHLNSIEILDSNALSVSLTAVQIPPAAPIQNIYVSINKRKLGGVVGPKVGQVVKDVNIDDGHVDACSDDGDSGEENVEYRRDQKDGHFSVGAPGDRRYCLIVFAVFKLTHSIKATEP